VASGVRRITALTGDNVIDYYKDIENRFNEVVRIAKSTPDNVAGEIGSMFKLVKDLTATIKEMKNAAARDAVKDVCENVTEIEGVKFLAATPKDVEMNDLRDLSDSLKAKIGEGVVVLLSEVSGKANVVISATEGAIAKGVHAGSLIKEVAKCVGGGGGGRPNMAQAGGKNPAGIDDAVKAVSAELEKML
jgi:alanyl-tRNA synthetase